MKSRTRKEVFTMYDIGIIGGGTAGLTAAIYGQRAGKKTIVFEGTNFGGPVDAAPAGGGNS